MNKAVAYMRVSTLGQVDNFGLPQQKEIIEKYALDNDYDIVEWFIDGGISGIKEERPEMNRLLKGYPNADTILVAKSDRIARDIKLYYYYLMLFEKKRMHLVSCTEEIVNDETGLGNVMKSLMLFVAEQERKNITQRTMGGRNQKARTGAFSGGRPAYGYDVINHLYYVNPKEAPIVRKIFELKEGGFTLQGIADYINNRGIRTRRGIEFSRQSVRAILLNKKLYQGYYKYNSDDWIKGKHEAILRRREK